MEEYYLITFENTHGAMNTESEFIKEKIKCIMMPTPTHITKSCGLSLRVNKEEFDKIKVLMQEDKIKIKKMYMKVKAGFCEINV